MPKKRFGAEQIVALLRQIEVATSSGKSIAVACREAGISDQSYFRWRKEYGGLDLDQVGSRKLERSDQNLCLGRLAKERQQIRSMADERLTQRPFLEDISLILSSSSACPGGQDL